MIKRFPFKQVDVFTRQPYQGNPVAVVLGAQDLSTQDMQRIAGWTGITSTTFVLPPSRSGADYRLRIFTPRGELPFAGHPTLGSAHALLESDASLSGKTRLMQECQAGLLELHINGEGSERKISVQVPQPKVSRVGVELSRRVGAALGAIGIEGEGARIINVGAQWLVMRLASEKAVHEVQPSLESISALSREAGTGGVTVFSLSEAESHAVYLRTFAPEVGIPENPTCGSGNAAVGAYLLHARLLDETGHAYRANQGVELGRNGFVDVEVDANTESIRIGGYCITCIDGHLSI